MIIDFGNGITFSPHSLKHVQQINVKLSRMKRNETHFKISLENFHFVNEFKAWLISANNHRRMFFERNAFYSALFGSRSISIHENWNLNHAKYQIIVILLQNVDFVAQKWEIFSKIFAVNSSECIQYFRFHGFRNSFIEKQPIIQLKVVFCFETNNWDHRTGNLMGATKAQTCKIAICLWAKFFSLQNIQCNWFMKYSPSFRDK